MIMSQGYCLSYCRWVFTSYESVHKCRK